MIVNGKQLCWASYRNIRGKHVHCRKSRGHAGACGPQGQTLAHDRVIQREAAMRRRPVPAPRTMEGTKLTEKSRRRVLHVDGTEDGTADYTLPISKHSRSLISRLVRLGIYGRTREKSSPASSIARSRVFWKPGS
jgi:hypothetical protein